MKRKIFTAPSGRFAAAVAATIALAACSLPKGFDVRSEDWRLFVPVGEYDFNKKDDKGNSLFSLDELHPDNLQKKMFPDDKNKVYNGIENDKRIYTGGIDALKQQTYLIHYSVPLGLEEMQKEMIGSLNKSLKEGLQTMMSAMREQFAENGITSLQDGDGFIEQPPYAQPLAVPVTVNVSDDKKSDEMRGEDYPSVKKITGLQYDVVLTFKELPKKDGEAINKNNKEQFADWVKFYDSSVDIKTDENPVHLPGTTVILADTKTDDDYSDPLTVIWRSPPITVDTAGGADAKLVTIALDLDPKLELPTQANRFKLTRGICYKVMLAVHTYESITLNFTQGSTLGNTSEFEYLTETLKGIEFKQVDLYLFLNLETGNGGGGGTISFKAVQSGKPDVDLMGNNTLVSKTFSKNAFYVDKTGAAQADPDPSVPKINLIDKGIFRKNAGVYDLKYYITGDTVIKPDLKCDIAIVVPLAFMVKPADNDEDIQEVVVKDDEGGGGASVYYKLNVLDDMLGSGEEDFDIKEKVEALDIGTINWVKAPLTVKNQILPSSMVIGFDSGEKDGGKPVYKKDHLIQMREAGKPVVTSNLILMDEKGKTLVPKPALLIKPAETDAKGCASFVIEPITVPAEQSKVSVDIAAEVSIDLRYGR